MNRGCSSSCRFVRRGNPLLALFALARGEAGFAAFASDLTTTRDALAVGAGAAFAVPAAALFLSGCAARAEDVFAEAAERAGATFVVDSVALPVAFFRR